MHIVHFDGMRKIQQIRIYWDQGALLKAVEVIGGRAKNWPIKDGKDQIRFIKSAAATAGTTISQVEDVVISSRPSTRSNPTADPHASLSLFAPRHEQEEDDMAFASPPVAPRASAKPPPRDYHDLFVDGPLPASKDRPASPTKENVMAPKFGAGKNYAPSRIFDLEEPERVAPPKSPSKMNKSTGNKYGHFEFADEHDESEATPVARPLGHSKQRDSKKHQSQWGFEDFVTPAKVNQKMRPHETRNFEMGNDSPDATPVKRGVVHQARPDSEAHFEFLDDGGPAGDRRPGHARGVGSSSTRGQLYENNLYDEEGQEPSKTRKERSDTTTSTNLRDRHETFDPHFEMADVPTDNKPQSKAATGLANVKDRRKDFDPHFTMTDSSPGLGEKSASDNNRPISDNRSKTVKKMDAQWEQTDQSPAAKNHRAVIGEAAGKENRGIKTGGDGMGNPRGGRAWDFGDDGTQEEASPPKNVAKGGRRTAKNDSFWEF